MNSFKKLVLNESMIAQSLQGNTTSSTEAITTAATWIKSCNEKHEQCQNHGMTDWYPTRLLHVGDGATDKVRLLSTSQEQPSAPYMTLSYCWGALQPIKLLQETESSLLEGMNVEELPQTFRDAVAVTRSCAISYLWIDSLCIRQDDTEDWATESLQMHKVYKNSYLNISADWGDNSSTGLFQQRDPLTHSLAPLRLHSNISELFGQRGHGDEVIFQLFSHFMWRDNVEESHISTRGWVLQERYLSPRVLHFGQRQLFWECRQSQVSESYPVEQPDFDNQDLPLRLKRGTTLPSQSEMLGDYEAFWHTSWKNVVVTYSSTNLTESGDKLMAISGIAKDFGIKLQVVNDVYLAGLWRRDLHIQLLWHAVGRPQSHRPTQYRAPTWSWAAVDGEIGFEDDYFIKIEGSQFKVLNTELVLLRDDATGPVKGGYIELEGYVGCGRVLPAVGSNSSRTYRFRASSRKAERNDDVPVDQTTYDLDATFDFSPDSPNEDFPQSIEHREFTRYFLLANTSESFVEDIRVYIIILESVMGEPGIFRRCGIASNRSVRRDSMKAIMGAIFEDGGDIPCMEYKDGLHTIRIV